MAFLLESFLAQLSFSELGISPTPSTPLTSAVSYVKAGFWLPLGALLLPYSTNYTLYFTVKVVACLAFLILIRGGVPRYRYDILTKLGWVKFLTYILALFVLTVCFFLSW